MNLSEKAQTLMTHSTYSAVTDDLGQPWYNYEQYGEIPKGIKFNVRKIGNGMMQYELKGEDGRINTFVSVEDEQYIYNLNFNSSGIPTAFKAKDLSSFNQLLYQEQILATEAVKKSRGYIKHFKEMSKDGMGVFIYSKSEGSGKTHLVCAIANEIMEKYQASVKFLRAVNFFAEMKRNISAERAGSDPYAKSNLFETTIQANILIIDDIGAGAQSMYTSELIYEIISKRVQQNKVTLFTSKRAFSQLAYDTSTLMAIQEKCISITLPNENIGKAIIKNNNKRYEDLLNS